MAQRGRAGWGAGGGCRAREGFACLVSLPGSNLGEVEMKDCAAGR